LPVPEMFLRQVGQQSRKCLTVLVHRIAFGVHPQFKFKFLSSENYSTHTHIEGPRSISYLRPILVLGVPATIMRHAITSPNTKQLDKGGRVYNLSTGSGSLASIIYGIHMCAYMSSHTMTGDPSTGTDTVGPNSRIEPKTYSSLLPSFYKEPKKGDCSSHLRHSLSKIQRLIVLE